jgi:hypothetical protein
MSEALGTVHTHRRGLLWGWWCRIGPELVSDQIAASVMYYIAWNNTRKRLEDHPDHHKETQMPIHLDILTFLHFIYRTRVHRELYWFYSFMLVLSLITCIGGQRVKVPIYAYNIYTSSCVRSKNSP